MLILKQIVIFNKRIFHLYFLLKLSSVCSTKAQQVIFNRFTQPEGSFSGVINGISQDTLAICGLLVVK